jgi:hypothetical protein
VFARILAEGTDEHGDAVFVPMPQAEAETRPPPHMTPQ